jgi:hypothetical protein
MINANRINRIMQIAGNENSQYGLAGALATGAWAVSGAFMASSLPLLYVGGIIAGVCFSYAKFRKATREESAEENQREKESKLVLINP